MSTIDTTIRDVSLLKHRDTVLTPADQDEFVTKFETTMDELSEQLVTDINDVSGEMNVVADEVNTNASNASTSASNASTSEGNASTSATQAGNYAASYSATSTTSVLIGTGAKTFTVQADKLFVVGQFLLISSDADSSKYMHGQVTSYSGTTLEMNITNTGSSSTFADWNVVISGTRGAVGGGLTDVVDDGTPQQGGDLDANGYTYDSSSYRQIADASLGTGTHTFDYSAGDMQELTATGDITIAFSNFVTGKVCVMIVEATNWGAFTITYPAGIKFPNKTSLTYTASGTDEVRIKKDMNDVYSMSINGLDFGTV